MNYHSNFKNQEQKNHNSSLVINYQQQMVMLIETLQFVVEKIGELYQWQQEEIRVKRRKSLMKVFDKNIQNISGIKGDNFEVPIFDQFSKFGNKLQIIKTSLPQIHLEEHSPQKFKNKTNKQLKNIHQTLTQHSTRIESIEQDILELISLYKDVL